ncbi:hypothetical protein PFISCL1PPCAC_3694, partial [Pristionchus fissidentatus]
SDLPFTLGHTNMWTNNILFSKKEKSEELQLLAFIDWQNTSVCNPLLDVVSVIGINMNANDRRKHEREILQHYIDEMKKRSHRFKKKFPIDTVEKLLPEYRKTLRFAALQLLMFVPSEKTEELGVLTQRFIRILEDIV